MEGWNIPSKKDSSDFLIENEKSQAFKRMHESVPQSLQEINPNELNLIDNSDNLLKQLKE